MDTKTTNYLNAFITVSPDCPAKAGERPEKPDSVAGLQYALLSARPYALTSDDLLFEVYARRNAVPAKERARARTTFFQKSQACLRASPLVKRYGWGLHHDENGKVAAYGAETAEYRKLASKKSHKVVAGLRSRRA
jgi:hypothetical protein